MGSIRQEFSRCPAVWVVMFLSGGMLFLVNQIEASFARSLIECETPVSKEPGTLFTGSAKCGDRAFVINEGQMLSATAQSFEFTSKILILLFAAIFSDLYGRKAMTLIGVGATSLSVFCFLVSTQIPSLARFLFIAGQALQGASPMDLIGSQICTDLAARDETDTQCVFALGEAQGQVMMVLFGSVMFFLQRMEIVDYTIVWFLALLVNLGVVVIVCLFQGETRVKKAEDDNTNKSVIAQAGGELRDYAQLLSSPGMTALMVSVVLKAAADALFTLGQSAPMAFFKMSQDAVLLAWVPVIVIAIVCTGIVPAVCAKYGERKAYWWSSYYLFFVNLGFFFAPLSRVCFFGTYYMFMVIVPGIGALSTAMSTKFLGDKMAKFTALSKLSSYGLSIISGPTYAALFDAKAVGYLARSPPFLLAVGLRFLELIVWYHPTLGAFRCVDATLDMLAEERIKNESSAQDEATDKKKD